MRRQFTTIPRNDFRSIQQVRLAVSINKMLNDWFSKVRLLAYIELFATINDEYKNERKKPAAHDRRSTSNLWPVSHKIV